MASDEDLTSVTEAELIEEYFVDIVKDNFNINSIGEFKVDRGYFAGKTATSNLFRVFINDGDSKEASMVVKFMPENAPQSNMLKALKLFAREAEMYEKVIPAFEELFAIRKETVRFSPKFYGKRDSPEMIVMEDLVKLDYKHAKDSMDMNHVCAVLEKLAKFHAASAVFDGRRGPFSNLLADGIFSDDLQPIMEQIQNYVWSGMVDSMENLNISGLYTERLKNYSSRIYALNKSSLECNPKSFNVLNHGDFWASSILFQYDVNRRIKNVRFVDFQQPKWGSPAQDLQHFIMSSVAKDLKISKFNYMIEFYHNSLISNLKLLGYAMTFPNLVILQKDILKRGFIGVYASLTALPAALAKYEEDPEPSKEERNPNAVYRNHKFLDEMEILLPYFYRRNLLNF